MIKTNEIKETNITMGNGTVFIYADVKNKTPFISFSELSEKVKVGTKLPNHKEQGNERVILEILSLEALGVLKRALNNIEENLMKLEDLKNG